MNKKKASKSEIEEEIRKHVAAEERAYRWVEHLAIVDSISKSDVDKMINEIMITHYKDMVEERAISKICGYPICSNKLIKKLGNQKYHISTKLNKVFDISERKLFCSPFCFNASNYLEQQIPESPLWLRNDSFQKKIDLFTEGMKASSSTCQSDVLLGIENIKLEDIENPQYGDHREEEEGNDESDHWGKFERKPNVTSQPNSDLNKLKKSKLIEPNVASEQSREDLEEKLATLKNLLKDWSTVESYKFLQSLKSDRRNERFEKLTARTNSDDRQFEVKTRKFLSDNPEWKRECSADTQQKLSRKPLLPTVDSQSQKTIRRRIVKEKIHQSFNKLTKVSHLVHSDSMFHTFYKLIDTFRFTSKNIILTPKEWLTMSVLLLKILASYEKQIEDAISTDIENLNDFLMKEQLCDLQAVNNIVKEFKSEVLFERDEKDDGDENSEENSVEDMQSIMEYVEELD